MTAAQRLFWEQAAADFRIYQILRRQPACHPLHYLQMCTEKLGKAWFWRSGRPHRSHAYFVKFLRAVANNSVVSHALGFARSQDFDACVRGVLPMADALENLSPDLAGDGPNPEYPWPPDDPQTAPIAYAFPLWSDLRRSVRGRELVRLVRLMLDTFPRWA